MHLDHTNTWHYYLVSGTPNHSYHQSYNRHRPVDYNLLKHENQVGRHHLYQNIPKPNDQMDNQSSHQNPQNQGIHQYQLDHFPQWLEDARFAVYEDGEKR